MSLNLEKNLVRIIVLGPFLFIPFLTILISYFTLIQNQNVFEQNVKNLKDEYFNREVDITTSKIDNAIKLIEFKKSTIEKMLKEKVKMRADSAYAIAKNIYDQNREIKSEKEIEKIIIDSLRPLVWNGGESFIFMLDYSGVFHLAPSYLKHLEGSSIIDFQDMNGRFIIREEIDTVKKKGSGYLWDTFTRPNYDTSRQFNQFAYVKNLGFYNLYIGSSEYLDIAAKEMEESMLETLRNFEAKKSNYFFVIDKSANAIMLGDNSELEGKNILSIRDSDGKEFVKDLIKSACSDKPYFVTYKWKNPISKMIELKYSYVKCVPESDWIIGSGFYLDELNRDIEDKKKELQKNNKNDLQCITYISIIVLFISLILSYVISKMVKRKFQNYSKRIEAKSKEFIELNRSLEERVEKRTAELKEAHEKMRKIAVTDSLTDIYNRYYFMTTLKDEIRRTQRYNSSFSLIMFDIDNFKDVNDNYGHDEGDKVLIKIAEIVTQELRESDIFARVGGEEFMIILPETTLKLSSEIAKRVRVSIANFTHERVGNITISLGLVSYKLNESLEHILKRVDLAMYEAKGSGRNKLIIDT